MNTQVTSELKHLKKRYQPARWRTLELQLRVLNNSSSQTIIDFLLKNGESNVSEIYIGLRWEQSVASQHLAHLRRINVVKDERRGKFVYYDLNYEKLDAINSLKL